MVSGLGLASPKSPVKSPVAVEEGDQSVGGVLLGTSPVESLRGSHWTLWRHCQEFQKH